MNPNIKVSPEQTSSFSKVRSWTSQSITSALRGKLKSENLDCVNKVLLFHEIGVFVVWHTASVPLLKEKLSGGEWIAFYPSRTVSLLIVCLSCQRVVAVERSDPMICFKMSLSTSTMVV